MKKTVFSILLGLASSVLLAQGQWMTNRVTNTSMVLDPTEVQVSGSITSLLDRDILKNQYLPFSFGVAQSIYSKVLEEQKSWEIVGELGSFTQFEWKEVEGAQQRNLINVDYRIAFSYARQLNESVSYRIRFFHVSSHLGDDYIFRNRIRSHTENKMNYEQLDFTYFKRFSAQHLVYGGLGSVIRPNSPRLPFSFYAGWQKDFRRESKKWTPTAGVNLKSFQETNFNLNVKLAAGMAYFTESKQEPVRLMLEYYKGHLPYSQLEQTRTEWFGMGLYFYI